MNLNELFFLSIKERQKDELNGHIKKGRLTRKESGLQPKILDRIEVPKGKNTQKGGVRG